MFNFFLYFSKKLQLKNDARQKQQLFENKSKEVDEFKRKNNIMTQKEREMMQAVEKSNGE